MMISLNRMRWVLWMAVWLIGAAGCKPADSHSASAPSTNSTLLNGGVITVAASDTNTPAPASPAPASNAPSGAPSHDFTRTGKIAQLVGRIMEQAHYSQQPLNDEISQKWLKAYFDSLDYFHMVFNQGDLDEFTAKYGNQLDDTVFVGDVSPAFAIYDRFVQRLQEKQDLIQKLLKEKYDFTVDENYLPIRDKAPWPKTPQETEQLWRKRIKAELLQGKLNKEKPETTLKQVSRRYDRFVKTMKVSDDDEILSLYLNALTHSYDPHSDYFDRSEAENFDINNIKLKLTGIGAVLRPEDGYAKIVSLVPGGPADLDKRLKPNDRIIAVGQGNAEPVDVIDMKLNKVVEMIRGERGSEVRLTIIPADAPDGAIHKVIALKRDEIKLTEQEAKAEIIEHRNEKGEIQRIGVIVLPEFYDNTSMHVARLIERLKSENLSGLILDLRKNGGGLLEEAISLAGLFVNSGPVVQVRDAHGRIQHLDDSDGGKVMYDGPLMVLVSRLSASASEIVAGALQDYGRSLTVGDQSTHGKGTVQTLVPLDKFFNFGFGADSNPGKLKLTVQKFYRIAGGSTQKKGVIPDITLPSLLDYPEIGEASLPNCLPYDEIPKADYQTVNLVAPYLAELKQKSAARVAASTDFAYVKEDIDFLKKKLADKTISLNEQKRLKEKETLLAQRAARKKERSQRSTAKDKVYELTLEMLDKNQPPVDVATLPHKPSLMDVVNADDDSSSDGDKEKDAENEPIFDPQMDEAINIMADYSRLMSKPAPKVTRDRAAGQPAL